MPRLTELPLATGLSDSDVLAGVQDGEGRQFSLGDIADFAASGPLTASAFTMNTAKVLGRATAANGAIEELTAAQLLSLLGLASGTYTPTASDFNNVTSVVPQVLSYLKIGNVVSVAGRVDFRPNNVGICSITLSLPFNSAFTATHQAGGTLTNTGQGRSDLDGTIQAHTSGNKVTLEVVAGTALGLNAPWFFQFQYQII